jgi:hypothetical protein
MTKAKSLKQVVATARKNGKMRMSQAYFDLMLEGMQMPEELGKAAVEAAKRKK